MKKKTFLGSIGPAFLTTTSVFGPAAVLMTGIAGAKFGYSCFWVLWVLLLDRFVFLDIGTRVGKRIKTTYGDEIRGRYGKVLAFLTCFTLSIPMIIYTSSNTLGTALAATVVFDGDILVYGLIFLLIAVLVTINKKSFKLLTDIAVVLMLIMFFTFLVTMCIVGIDFEQLLRGLVPDFRNGPACLAALSIFLTISSQQGAVHQYLVSRQNRDKNEGSTVSTTDHVLSSLFLIAIVGMIMVVSAETLGKSHTIPSTANEFALMLEPASGKLSCLLFGIGLFAAAITSLNGVSNIAGLVLSDAFGKLKTGGSQKLQKTVSIVIIVVMGLYGLLPSYFGWVNPLDIYLFVSLMTSITIPMNGVFMLLLSSNKDFMGDLMYKKGFYVLAWVIYIFVVFYCSYNFLVNYII